jgi:hypothetical protein
MDSEGSHFRRRKNWQKLIILKSRGELCQAQFKLQKAINPLLPVQPLPQEVEDDSFYDEDSEVAD